MLEHDREIDRIPRDQRGETREAPDLSANAISAPGARAEALTESIRDLARQRASALSSVSPNRPQLSDIDRALESELLRHAEQISASPELLETLRAEARLAEDKERLSLVKQTVGDLARAAGEAQGRVIDSSALDSADRAITGYLRSQSDLIIRYPELAPAIRDLRKDGERAGIERRLEADRRAITIYKSLVGILKDCETVCEVLSATSADERRLLREAYRERYGDDLREKLESSFSKLKRSRVIYLVDGDIASASADGLALALRTRRGKRLEAVERVIARLPAGMGASIEEIFAKRHAESFDVTSLGSALSKRLEPLDVRRVQAMLRGDRASASAALVRKEIAGGLKKELVIYRTLEKMTPREVVEMQPAYESEYGSNLRKHLAESLPPGPQRDRTLALLDGDQISAYAALLRCRLMGHKGDWIGGPFQNGDAPTRAAVIEAYNRMYDRDFSADLRRGIRKSDLELMEPLIRDGEVSSAVILYHCMLGIGTDEAGIIKILTGASKLEIEQIKKTYAELYKRGSGEGRDLVRDLELELSGDALFDVQELMRGAPETPAELYRSVMARHHHERSGSLIRRVDIITKEGRIMDEDVRAVAEHYESRIARHAAPTAREVQRLETLARIASQDFESFRNIKTWAANQAANMVAGAIGGAVTYTAVTLGVPLFGIVACAGAASMATRTLMKYNIKGGGYGREEVIRDTLLAAIDGGTLFMGRLVSSVLAQKLLKMAASAGLKQAVGLTQYIDRVRHSEHILAEKLKSEEPREGTCRIESIRLEASRLADSAFEGLWKAPRSSGH